MCGRVSPLVRVCVSTCSLRSLALSRSAGWSRAQLAAAAAETSGRTRPRRATHTTGANDTHRKDTDGERGTLAGEQATALVTVQCRTEDGRKRLHHAQRDAARGRPTETCIAAPLHANKWYTYVDAIFMQSIVKMQLQSRLKSIFTMPTNYRSEFMWLHCCTSSSDGRIRGAVRLLRTDPPRVSVLSGGMTSHSAQHSTASWLRRDRRGLNRPRSIVDRPSVYVKRFDSHTIKRMRRTSE